MTRGLVWVVIATVLVAILFLAVALPSYVPRRVTESKNACLNHLRQIDGAKEQWALVNNAEKGAAVTVADLTGANGYLLRFPECPNGGTYTIGALGKDPTCTVKGHTISFPVQ